MNNYYLEKRRNVILVREGAVSNTCFLVETFFFVRYDKRHAPHCYKYPILKINHQKFIIIQVVDSFLVNKPSGNLFICVPGMQIKRASAHWLIYSIFFFERSFVISFLYVRIRTLLNHAESMPGSFEC